MRLYEKHKPAEFLKNFARMEQNLRELHLEHKGYTPKFSMKYFQTETSFIKVVTTGVSKQLTIAIQGTAGSGKSR
jgi:hypothetical protein